jgi:hypothetical protein
MDPHHDWPFHNLRHTDRADDEGFAKAVEEFVLQRGPYIAGIGTTAGDNK